MAYGLTQSMRLTKASSEYATIADNTSLSIPGDDLTIEFWVKMKETLSSAGRWMVVKSTGNTTNREYEIVYQNFGTAQLGFYFFTGGVPTNFFESICNYTLTEDTWFHVAITVDVSAAASSKANWYINGVLQSSTGTNYGTGATVIYDGTSALRIGQSDPVTAGYYPDAQFSLIRIWDVIRTGTEISTNMCNVLGATTNLQAEWTLDNTYADNSGNGNTLTGINTPTFIADVPSTCGTVAASLSPTGAAYSQGLTVY